jgi:hypothetical protein
MVIFGILASTVPPLLSLHTTAVIVLVQGLPVAVPVYICIAALVNVPALVSISNNPLGGTVTVYHTSLLANKPQVGAGMPAAGVVLAI